MTPTQENPNVFDDEFEVDGFEMVADGFRPGGHTEESEGEEHHTQDPPIRTVSAHYATNPALTMTASTRTRDSMRKSRNYDNPFTSPEDEPRLEFERTPSMHSQSTSSYAPGIARRSTSSASSQNFAGTHSPRFGAGGPSHPYAMYPQGTVPRSPSVATSSTLRASIRSSSARQEPQHPYTLYPQGLGEDDIGDDTEPESHIPVPLGFPGRGGQAYQRIRGPDGEEQDIIGVDGHTEQLPPYSRYPEDGPKLPIVAVPTQLHTEGPVAGTDPGMPLMHQPIAPPREEPQARARQSMTDQSILDRHSVIDRVRDGHASLPLMERVRSEDTDWTQKSWKEKTWREKRRTRFCGVPLIWIVIAACVVGFVAAVLGGVLGGYISGSKHERQKSILGGPSTSLWDASRIASPTVAPPTGTYALSLSTPEATQADCLVDQSQAQAWDCNLVGNPALAMSVGVPAGPQPTTGAFLFYGSTDTEICYGAQYQFMGTQFSPFLTVQDNDYPDHGPAFYFEHLYDKIVVLPESAFPVPTPGNGNKQKRQWTLPPGWGAQKQVVTPGEKPWFCVWNNTLIETFIYVQQPIPLNFTDATPSSSYPSSTGAPANVTGSVTSTAATLAPSPPPSTAAPTTATSASGVPLTGSFTMTISNPTTTTTVVAPSSASGHDGYPPWARSGGDDDDDHKSKTKRWHQIRQSDMYDTLQLYPYIVKIEERRLANNAVQPYCQQYQILNNGEYNWVPDANGNAIIINLAESDPAYSAYVSAGVAGSNTDKKLKRQIPRSCHCQWWSGQ